MTQNKKLSNWVNDMAKLCKPDKIHWCNGTEDEFSEMIRLLTESGTCMKLNEDKKPNSYYFKSDPKDVARVEDRTFICSEKEIDAGPTNNWKNPKEMKEELLNLFNGTMRGRTMYVIPFSMGPIGSKISMNGVQLTDSPYVVISMKIMTRMGAEVMNKIEDDFVPCIHSVGYPLENGTKDIPWPCNETKYIVHFPEERAIWSYGSGYGGNALLGKKCFSLRIASKVAKDEGWLAEHMLIVGITSPEGKKHYFAAAFPSACGKTNLAMLKPSLPGWKVETVGDDIAWMRFGNDGRLYAINPENGFFGVAPGTSMVSNPNAFLTLEKNSLFTNTALTDDKDVWWEGLTSEKPEHLIDWNGNDWTPKMHHPAAHPNSRFTTSASQCPTMDQDWENPNGVPISAIIFGGRRASFIPLVYEAFSWQHGTFIGATVSSETTAAAAHQVGQLRNDPFAMLPFCGYNMGDYFGHWLKISQSTASEKLPKIFNVNWFRKDNDGKFLWPGYGENIRVLQWIFERVEGNGGAVYSPLGNIPTENSIDLRGLNLPAETMKELFNIDKEAGLSEAERVQNYFTIFGEQLPKEMNDELEKFKERFTKL
ncbi:MAG: phosphoenolpyruvate carboxykinase (GTP) [Ignavibacteria bacterium]|nr:MAG: phosphoenolpyruvate carboxykinase (GTP) [Ignavibacteria bacterium]KAF0161670.1 MAG: phosphoenolpyruvate carboxykinase (GTP) [Ignavibacteria bacterium]